MNLPVIGQGGYEMSMPEAIEQTRLELQEALVTIEDCKHEQGVIEDALCVEIAVARDERDKPLYSNEAARGAELRDQLRRHEGWQTLDRARRAAERNRVTLDARLERMRRAHNEFLAVLEYEAGMARLQAAQGSSLLTVP